MAGNDKQHRLKFERACGRCCLLFFSICRCYYARQILPLSLSLSLIQIETEMRASFYIGYTATST